MQSLLADCRALFGAPPRRFGIVDWGYLHVPPPDYAREVKLDDLDACARIRLPLHAALDQELLRRHGRVVWGCLLHANSELFSPGVADRGGAVVYGEADDLDADPGPLLPIALALKHSYRRPDDPEVRRIGAVLDHELSSLGDVAAPAVLAQGRDIRCADLFVHRRHLPDGVLAAGFFPLLVAREHTPVAVPLPARFWPADLVAYWATSDGACLRPSARATLLALEAARRGDA